MNFLPKENIYGHTKKIRFILKHMNQYLEDHSKPISVLDFGCGNGIAVSQFLIKDNINYFGVDIHEPSLNYARNHFGKGNAIFLDHVPKETLFDVIVYADILEHLEEPVSILQEHCSLLKEDGFIVGAVPNGFGPFENEKRIDNWLGISRSILWAAKIKRRLVGSSRGYQGEIVPYNHDSGHVQFFTKKSLDVIFQSGGFKIDSFINGAFAGAPLSELILLRGEKIAELNSSIADFLPYWAVSTWYFTAKKR